MPDREALPHQSTLEREQAAGGYLWHVYFEATPERAHCGVSLDPNDPVKELNEPCPAGDADCIVCAELARAYIAGRWHG